LYVDVVAATFDTVVVVVVVVVDANVDVSTDDVVVSAAHAPAVVKPPPAHPSRHFANLLDL
jgi:hypothetical protein